MLNIYKEAMSDTGIDGDNKLLTVHNGRLGSWFIRKYYLRNDDDSVRYTGIVLSIEDVSSSGATYQLFEGPFEPTALEWNFVGINNSIVFEDIIGDTTYLPFWLRVFYPGETPANTYQEANIKIVAIEEAI